ncbi:MAG: YtxH domain-containing protein [Desulfovibrio sp.]
MSDVSKHPAPGASSQEGAYLRTPQQPSYYFQDANQYGVAYAPSGAAAQSRAVSPQPVTGLASWLNVTDPGYLKGLALGAGVALLVTNPKVQQAVVSGAVRLWAAIQGGVEEIKEQIQDVKAELSREE